MRHEDEADFCAFVAGQSSRLLRLAVLLVGDRGVAEDVLQEALMKTFLAWPRIRRRESVDAYARRTIVRNVLSWRRRRASSEIVTERVPDRGGGDCADPRPDRDLLWAALLTLPARQRAVVVLPYYEDLTEREVAALLGCAVGTVKSHNARALESLRSALAPADRVVRREAR